MNATIENLITKDVKNYEIHRMMFIEETLLFSISNGFIEDGPGKDMIYRIIITDEDTNNTIEKNGIFVSYNYVLDKDGDNQTSESDNSFTFRIV